MRSITQFRLVHHVYSVAGGAVPQNGGGLARAWTDGGPKVPRNQCPDEAPVGVDGTVATV